MSPTVYTHPFISDSLADTESLGNDTGELVAIVVGWQNLSRILTVLLKSVNEATCQCCGLHMTEVKSHHAVGQNGSRHWDSRGEVEGWIGDDGGMAMTVFLLFATPSTASEIIISG
jgi:hypothetical protein